jgi:regulatory protein
MSLSKEEILVKLRHYCAYQDRNHNEVRTKLLRLKVYGDLLEEVMSDLIDEDFLNEERYAQNFARGKFSIKGWGKIKIQNELRARRISEYSIKKAIKEVENEGGYKETLKRIIIKYSEQRKGKWQRHILRQKTFEHAIRKGYESNLIAEILHQVF